MKRFSAFALVSAALALAPVALLAESGRQPRIVTRPSAPGQPRSAQMVPKSVSLTGYSVQLNIVTRIQGLSFYRTAVDITNNTSTDGVTASFQYCYTDLNGVYQGCTASQSIVLHNFDNFHQDDVMRPGHLAAHAAACASFSDRSPRPRSS